MTDRPDAGPLAGPRASAFEIEINGRTRAVSIAARPASGGRSEEVFEVTIDGESHKVSAARTDLGFILLYGDGRSVDAAVTPAGPGQWFVQLPRLGLTAIVNGRRHRRGGAAGAAASGEQRLTAPMPGRVLRVLVGVGDEVTERQGLVVIEAMKMENELTAPRAGRVKEVAVSEGASIEAGRLLLVLE